MRNIAFLVRFVLLALLASPALGEDTLKIEFTATIPHGTFHLMQALRSAPHSSDYLREYFLELSSLGVEQQRALEEFEELLAEPQAQAAVEKLAVYSDDLDELAELLEKERGLEESGRLRTAFAAFTPAYEEHIWDPSQPFLKQHLEELADTSTMAEALTRARRFYGSDWPLKRGFTVALVPIPGNQDKRIRTSGHSLEEIQVMEIRPGQQPLTRACIAFHELCHALWDTRAQGWPELFAADPFAYGLLNEGLATALGNGWYDELVHERYPEGSWYYDGAIDTYAKALFPLVKSYLEPARQLDEEFAAQAIKLFQAALPEARELTAVAAIRTMMVSDELERVGPKTRRVVARAARVNSMTASTDLQAGLQQLRRGEVTLLIMLFSPASAPDEGLELKPEDWARLKAAAPTLEAFRHPGGWQLVLVADPEQGDRLLQRCLSAEKLIPGTVSEPALQRQ